MFNRDIATLNRISDTVGKISLEVALAQPGKDFGLLPVNCMLLELKDAAAKLPPEINAGVKSALACVDRVFETTGIFDEASIKQLTDWSNWMNGAVLDGLNDRPIKRFAGAPAAAPTAPQAEAELVLDIASDGELLVEFCSESQEHLQNIEQGVLVLETKPDDAETLSTIFRAFHTFKGGAGLLNLLPIKDLAHELETILDLARTAKLTVNKEIIDLILAGGDTFKRFIDAIRGQLGGQNAGAVICVPTLELLLQVRVITTGGKPAATAAPKLTVATETVVSEPVTESVLVLDLAGDGELLVEFCTESHEHLQNIEQGVLVLETKPDDADTLSTIFRAFHTFKGGAGLLNLLPIKELAHELETILDLARTHKLAVDKSIIDLILAGGDTFKQFINEIGGQTKGRNAGAEIRVPTQDLLSRVRVVSNGGTAKPAAAAKVASAPTQNTVAPVAPAAPVAAAPAKKAAPKAAAKAPVAEKAAGGSVVKVDTLKLDLLIDLVGEMVIAQSQVSQDEDVTAIESQRLTRNLAQLGRITKELQRNAMSLRMVPIRSTFQKMTRLVRDVSSKQGKQAELILHGEDTELDRTIVEEISDPLIHMIRNSVDHGVEQPDVRLAAGKSPVGAVHLSAFHQGGNIVIQIRDDGRGLNPEKLKSKALERGVITEKDRLSDKEAFALIFAAGFSTAEVVTEISGRGVGMDVVRRNIEKLRGKIDIESVLGHGTTFTISLPLTMAIIDGLIVTIGEQRFILPTLSVRESFRPTKEMLTTVHEKGEMVNVRGRLSPLLRMYEFYDVKPRTTDPTEALLVVVDNNGETRCLMVDQLLGKQEVVIKSLGETFKKAPAIAGGAILGDGRVGLIIDANSLVSLRNLNKAIAA